MEIEKNVLKRRDLTSLTLVENAFQQGPLADAMLAALSIERRSGLTQVQFEQEYRQQQRPVILEGFVNQWPSVKKWSFDYLANRCESTKVTVNSYSSQHAREVTFADFVHMMKENEGLGASPLYLQEWYYQTSCPHLAADMPELDICQYDFRRDLYGEAISTNHQLWLGQQGGVTRLHQDSYMIDVMHVQIVGEKHWSVMGPNAYVNESVNGQPDFSALCQRPSSQLMQCVLKPGDVLYLPAMWFHRIKLLSDSIGLGRKCLDQSNLRKHIHQRMAELLAMALNAEEVKETHPELFNVLLIRNRAWAKRMGINLSKLRP
ncbi:cupin-like domain-containing protein [Xenorhabdus bovienii]|uniref:cupin-like domain-containing protein n=1 Tax=Xenorhabdus bovienii TaxID=40576 RepID=UPI001EE06C83|nr:cupin-like domain-containing protein [Xenorhabdus bovienii]MCG3462480.1 cupin-like domain-containing protein [Xenorhabdus bovienii]